MSVKNLTRSRKGSWLVWMAAATGVWITIGVAAASSPIAAVAKADAFDSALHYRTLDKMIARFAAEARQHAER